LKLQPPKSVFNNLKFLTVEVSALVSKLQRFVTCSKNSIPSDILDRSGYILNLKARIHNDCHQHIYKAGYNENEIIVFRSIDNIAFNLERIGELCLDCTQHSAGLTGKKNHYGDNFEFLLDFVVSGIKPIERACRDNDSQLALKIARTQLKLDRKCQQLIEKYSCLLKATDDTDNLISTLFLVKSIKTMGDALLKISESLLSANLGHLITIDRYHALSTLTRNVLNSSPGKKLVFESMADTQSGSTVSGISMPHNEDVIAVYKGGKKHKLKEELQNVASWHDIYPGIAPKILSYRIKGPSAALLIEHLQGKTFEHIMLHGSDKLLDKALQKLTDTLMSVWKKTQSKKSINARYIHQLKKRLPYVYGIHPSFKQQYSAVADIPLPSFDKLLNMANKVEKNITTPFSVYIHGDFNTDNIIYDPQDDKINFIDLHRSNDMDYLQDISVFMVSNYRLQALHQRYRKRVLQVNLAMYRFAADFASHHKDNGYDLRLALALARSLATSVRFTLDKTLAKAMFYRSRYLIEQVVQLKAKNGAAYRLPIEELFTG